MLEEARSLIRAESHRPFTLVLNDGRRLPVEKPYDLGISPRPGGIHEKRETA